MLTILMVPAPLLAQHRPITPAPGPLKVELLEEWSGGLVVDLTLQGMSADPSPHHEGYHQLSIPGAGRLAEEGRPELPAVGRFIAIPHGARVTVEILQGHEIRIPALRPAPHLPPYIGDQWDHRAFGTTTPDPSVYKNPAVFPASRVEVETARDIRGCQMALLKLYPVRYDPAGQALLYTPRMRVRLLFEGGNGQFIDSVHRTPVFERFFSALLLNPGSLGQPDNTLGGLAPECEMLIITPTIFETEARRLAHWKNTRGIPTQVRTTAETGTTVADIDAWIEERYHNEWPHLSYVLFFGDVGGSGSVPCYYTPEDHDWDGIPVGTDHYYGVIDGSDEDYFPDLFLGRISVDSAENAGMVVDKILNYEQAPDIDGDWLDTVLLAAAYQFNRYFVPTSQAIHDYLAPQYTCIEEYESNQSHTEEVLKAINQGVFLTTHRGHGQDRNAYDPHTGWVKPLFTGQHVLDRLTNHDHLPVMFSVNCRSGWFDGETDGHVDITRESFCELLLRQPEGGVVGVIGDTRTSYSGYNDELMKGFIDAIWNEFDPAYPDGSAEYHLPSPLYQMGAVLNFGKFWMYDKYILGGGMEYPWPPTAVRNRIQFEVYHYHGDPSMEIWTGTPTGEWHVSYNPAFLGDTIFTVNDENLNNALVAVSREGVLLGRALASGNQAVVQFAEPLDQLGDLTICITRHDRLPFISTVPVETPEGPWVLYQDHQLNDADLGNGDGWVSPGETIALDLEMHNFGRTAAHNVTVTLICESGLAVPFPVQMDYPVIEWGQTVVNPDPFTIQVSPDCPDGETVIFTVSASDGVSTWESEFHVTIDGAHVAYYNHQVLDNRPGGGNQDFIADPGELFNLRVSLRNVGLVYASQIINAELTTPDSTFVDIRDPFCDFPNIAAGSVATSFAPHFLVALDQDIDCGEAIPMTLLVETAEGRSSTSFELMVGGRMTEFSDDMEQEGPGGWTTDLHVGAEDWWKDDLNPEGHPNLAWFSRGEAIESSVLEPAKDDRLISPTFYVSNNAVLRFWHRVVMEAGYDGCVLEISTDGQSTWTDLGDWITYGEYTHQINADYGSPISGRWAWSGTTGDTLTLVEVDLDAFAYSDANLRFRLVCDTRGLPADPGWHVDDVEVLGMECNNWLTPDETISAVMVCVPESGYLPFDVTARATITNDCNRRRLVTGTIDLQLASGYFMADLTTGTKQLGPGISFTRDISRSFPGHPLLVGTNIFRVSATDITPPPYGLPPYPISGGTAMATCEVECLIP